MKSPHKSHVSRRSSSQNPNVLRPQHSRTSSSPFVCHTTTPPRFSEAATAPQPTDTFSPHVHFPDLAHQREPLAARDSLLASLDGSFPSPPGCMPRLVIVDQAARQGQRWAAAITHAAESLQPGDPLYVYLDGHDRITDRTLGDLEVCFAAVARRHPQLDLVPLTPACWGAMDAALLQRLQVQPENVWATAATRAQLLGGGNGTGAPPGNEFPETSELEEDVRRVLEARTLPPASPAAGPLASLDEDLRAPYVAVGGTFDRLHAGHRLLLAAAAVATSTELFVGVTGDKLLRNKSFRDLIESYETREQAALQYIQRVNPRIVVESGPLLDPQEPTRAATLEIMAALVVSKETVQGGVAINEQRRGFGFPPLRLLTVSLMGSRDPSDPAAPKLSSTKLREQQAVREKEKEGQGAGRV